MGRARAGLEAQPPALRLRRRADVRAESLGWFGLGGGVGEEGESAFDFWALSAFGKHN